MKRYSKIKTGLPREIVLLKGRGCQYKRCTFCDYHSDGSSDALERWKTNIDELVRVTGEFGVLELLCSGSFVDLDKALWPVVRQTCLNRGISTVIVESHWMYRHQFHDFSIKMFPIEVKFKVGAETFDPDLRQSWNKGMGGATPQEIAQYFQHCNLLVGVDGQTYDKCILDILCALDNFERVCVNVFTENSTSTEPDPYLAVQVRDYLTANYKDDPRIDFLEHNTDFGVGGDA